jgi:hypothetical protein
MTTFPGEKGWPYFGQFWMCSGASTVKVFVDMRYKRIWDLRARAKNGLWANVTFRN